MTHINTNKKLLSGFFFIGGALSFTLIFNKYYHTFTKQFFSQKYYPKYSTLNGIIVPYPHNYPYLNNNNNQFKN